MTPGRIVWLYPKLTSWMGGPRFVFEVCKQLSRKHEVVVVTQQLTEDVKSAYAAESIQVASLDVPTFTDIRFWLRFRHNVARDATSLRDALQPGDAVISSMFPMNCVADRTGVPFLQIAYEPFAMFFDKDFQRGQAYPVRAFCKLVAGLHSSADISAVRHSSALLTLSQYERSNCLSVYGKDSAVVLEGVDTEFFQPRHDPSLEAKYAGRTVLFHSTGFDSYKGTTALMAALPALVRRVPDLKLLVSYTRVDDAALSACEALIRREGIADNVEFLGFLDYEALPAYYTLASLYLEPGTGRSMSLSSKEANACGTPSVRGRAGTEDTVDGVTGILVTPQDSSNMAARIAGLLEDPGLVSAMGEEARDYVLRDYSWDAVAGRVESHITDLVSGETARREGKS